MSGIERPLGPQMPLHFVSMSGIDLNITHIHVSGNHIWLTTPGDRHIPKQSMLKCLELGRKQDLQQQQKDSMQMQTKKEQQFQH